MTVKRMILPSCSRRFQAGTAQPAWIDGQGELPIYPTSALARCGPLLINVDTNALTAAERLAIVKDKQTGILPVTPADISTNAPDTAIKILMTKAKLAALPKVTAADLSTTAPAIALDISGVRTALGKVPSSTVANRSTNAPAVAGMMGHVRDAVNSIPTSKHINISATVAKDVKRASPSPIEQTMMAIDEFTKRAHTIKVNTAGMASVKELISIVSQVGDRQSRDRIGRGRDGDGRRGCARRSSRGRQVGWCCTWWDSWRRHRGRGGRCDGGRRARCFRDDRRYDGRNAGSGRLRRRLCGIARHQQHDQTPRAHCLLVHPSSLSSAMRRRIGRTVCASPVHAYEDVSSFHLPSDTTSTTPSTTLIAVSSSIA